MSASFGPPLPSSPYGSVDFPSRMRSRSLLIVLVLIALTVAACGGGDGGNGEGTTGIFDTGVFATTEAEVTPPLTETTATPEPPLQITVPKGQPIGPQSPAEKVAEIQRALIALGFKIGKPDGIYGEKTRKAVVKFQKAHKLDADGLVGTKTAKALNKELAKLAAG